MRLLYLTEETISIDKPLLRGGAIHVRKVVQGLRSRGHTVHLLDWQNDAIGDNHYSVHPRTKFVDGPIRTFVRAIRIGWRHQLDAIVSKTRKTYVPGFLAAQLLGVTHLVHVGSLPEPTGGGLWPRLDNASFTTRLRLPHDGYLVVCQAIGNSLRNLGIDDSAVHNVQNAVDGTRFSPASATGTQDSLSVSLPDTPIVGYIGGLYKYKGVQLLAEALEKVDTDFHVLIAGDGPEREALVDRLGTDATFLGVVPYASMPGVYDAIDVLALPSYTEGLPRVILEAQSMVIPVVATRVGGVPEVVEDGVTGLLCQPGDSTCLSEAIETLLSNSELRASIGRNGRAQVKSEFSWERLYDRYERALGEIVT